MKRTAFISLTLLLGSFTAANAGSFINGTWTPGGCGAEPVVPAVDQSSVAAFNKSIDAVNIWRDMAEAYDSCLIDEANTDTRLIAKAANNQQVRLQAIIEKINAETETAKENFDKHKK